MIVLIEQVRVRFAPIALKKSAMWRSRIDNRLGVFT